MTKRLVIGINDGLWYKYPGIVDDHIRRTPLTRYLVCQSIDIGSLGKVCWKHLGTKGASRQAGTGYLR
jgi:hypothetical protein